MDYEGFLDGLLGINDTAQGNAKPTPDQRDGLNQSMWLMQAGQSLMNGGGLGSIGLPPMATKGMTDQQKADYRRSQALMQFGSNMMQNSSGQPNPWQSVMLQRYPGLTLQALTGGSGLAPMGAFGALGM